MNIEWDKEKAQTNLSKHGISFDDALLVFYDQKRIETYDFREDYGEDRWATIGLVFIAFCTLSTQSEITKQSA